MNGPCQRCERDAALTHGDDGRFLCAECAGLAPPPPETGQPDLRLVTSEEPPSRTLRTNVRSIEANTVRPETVRWLWQGWLPLGMVSLLAGLPGLGKSTLALKLAADVTRGELDGALRDQPSDVLVISYEDAIAETIIPRLIAANADLARVHLIECDRVGYAVDLTRHLQQIDALAGRFKARIMFIDPLVAGLPAGEISSHKDQDVRSVLAPIVTIAERRDLAALASMHFSKSAVDALLGVGGSIGFVGAARSVLVFGVPPDDENGDEGPARVLAHRKCNVAVRRPSRECQVQPRFVDTDDGRTIETSVVVIGDECEVHADDLVGVNKLKISPIVRAEKFLRQLLADGPHRAKEIEELAGDMGLSWRTVKRAKSNLGVDSFRNDGAWWWVLENDDDEENEEPADGPADEPLF